VKKSRKIVRPPSGEEFEGDHSITEEDDAFTISDAKRAALTSAAAIGREITERAEAALKGMGGTL